MTCALPHHPHFRGLEEFLPPIMVFQWKLGIFVKRLASRKGPYGPAIHELKPEPCGGGAKKRGELGGDQAPSGDPRLSGAICRLNATKQTTSQPHRAASTERPAISMG